ncbi:hypothetical protein [Rhizobium lusitanum]|uniref:Uncharacterized protein n=1 Tax=Rhizobium lusitanum TaxID=293958 RepID=A0A7X0MDR5_9HYPH|nr:hypothetical protein [Rhizobium lusitanum]MBB6486711.1 hypothetical protein [Rhizobium lusitanum]
MKKLTSRINSIIASIATPSSRALFDEEFYLQQYPDIASAAVDPFKHFLRYGIQENRRPNVYFDPSYYISQLSYQVANPIKHYVRVGAKLGLDPHPEFDSAWYLEVYPDVRKSGINPLFHYLRHGKREGRRTAPEYRKVFGKSMPAALGYRLPEYQNIVLSSSRVLSGAYMYHPELILPLQLPKHQHKALSTALVLTGQRDKRSVNINLSINSRLQPVSICIAFQHCHVQFKDENLTIGCQEVIAFEVNEGAPSFLIAAGGSVLHFSR